MSALNEAGVFEGVELHDELHAKVSDRTREIVEHRRRTGVIRGRGWLVRRLLLTADLLGLVVALALAEWIVTKATHAGTLSARDEIIVFLAGLPAWVVVAKLYGLYDRDEERTDYSTVDDFAGVFHMVTVCTWLFWVITQLTGVAHPTMPKILVFWAAAVVLIWIGRAGARALARRSVAYIQNAVIVGAGDIGQLVARKLLQHPEYGINIVGFVDSDPKALPDSLAHLAVLGGAERLPALVRMFDVERVIVAFSNDPHEETLELIRSLREFDLQVDIVPRLFELVAPGVGVHTVEGLAMIGLPPTRLSRSSRLLKRALDIALAVPALLLLSPLLVAVALAIKLGSPGPVFFRQTRVGENDRPFRIWKFRTMIRDAEDRKDAVAHLNKHLCPGGDPRMFKIPADPRTTRVGRMLRRYAIDELPQLMNVVAGQMSLVGPRPLIPEEDRYVTAWGRRRLQLKPGCTGPWQVLGGSDIPFEEMVQIDYLYVSSWSLLNDLKLILRTPPVMVSSSRQAI